MSRDREYLLDILTAARLAIQYVEGKTGEQFLADVQLQDSVIRRLEVLGAAARRVSQQARTQWPDLPWHSMTAMRDLLIHEYGDVDPAPGSAALVRNNDHLPPLREANGVHHRFRRHKDLRGAK